MEEYKVNSCLAVLHKMLQQIRQHKNIIKIFHGIIHSIHHTMALQCLLIQQDQTFGASTLIITEMKITCEVQWMCASSDCNIKTPIVNQYSWLQLQDEDKKNTPNNSVKRLLKHKSQGMDINSEDSDWLAWLYPSPYTAAHRFGIVIMALNGIFMQVEVNDNVFWKRCCVHDIIIENPFPMQIWTHYNKKIFSCTTVWFAHQNQNSDKIGLFRKSSVLIPPDFNNSK